MRWHFRKHRKKYVDIEDAESKEPKKSILRSKSREPCALKEFNGIDSELSMVDLRNACDVGSGTRDSNQSQRQTKFQSTHSLRSLDGTRESERSRRSVLFLDEFLTRKKQVEDNNPSIGSPSSLRTATPTSGSFSTFASYPASYQPSPVFQKRDPNNGIELISRSPLPRMRVSSESGTDVWSASSSGRDSFRNFSLTRHRKQKKQVCNDSFTDPLTGGLEATNNVSSYDVLARYNSNQSTFGSVSSEATRRQSGNKIPNSPKSNGTGFSSATNPQGEEPIVKRPVYPRVIEPRIKPVKHQDYSNNQNHANRDIILVTSNTNLTDSNVTLRPDCTPSASLETLTERSTKPNPITGVQMNGTKTGRIYQHSPQFSGVNMPINSSLPPPIPPRNSSVMRNEIAVENKTSTNVPAYRTIEVNLPPRKLVTEKPPLPGTTDQIQYHTKRSVVSSSNYSPHVLFVTQAQSVANETSSSSIAKSGSSPNQLVRVISITHSR